MSKASGTMAPMLYGDDARPPKLRLTVVPMTLADAVPCERQHARLSARSCVAQWEKSNGRQELDERYMHRAEDRSCVGCPTGKERAKNG